MFVMVKFKINILVGMCWMIFFVVIEMIIIELLFKVINEINIIGMVFLIED